MLFSSVTFLYWFLPITLILYSIIPRSSTQARNLVLLVVSLIFYAWGEPRYVLLMVFQCTAAWAAGLLIDKHRGHRASKVWTIVSAAISFSGLLFFKYTNFFITNISALTGMELARINLVMPIGISFYTFQISSYTFDLYMGRTEVQRSLLNFSTYVVLFPQLIAGPIVRYADIALELKKREHSIARASLGIRRFILGLGKKMLLANLFGELVSIYKDSGDTSVLFVWVYLAAYSLQVYFDFSGYSDMAIGLGHVFGFKFLENFNYPYIAGSITEFWRRWHMSLSSWFRDYVYIPMGGNRVSKPRHVLNILTVWAVTGFWHGADWNFILWGAYFGVILLLEKYVLADHIKSAPSLVRHAYVLLVVFISWAFFDAPSEIGKAFEIIGRMFGAGAGPIASREALYYLRSYALPLMLGIAGATPFPKYVVTKLESSRALLTVLEPLVLTLLLLFSTAYMVDGSFNPFIYFRF